MSAYNNQRSDTDDSFGLIDVADPLELPPSYQALLSKDTLRQSGTGRERRLPHAEERYDDAAPVGAADFQCVFVATAQSAIRRQVATRAERWETNSNGVKRL